MIHGFGIVRSVNPCVSPGRKDLDYDTTPSTVICTCTCVYLDIKAQNDPPKPRRRIVHSTRVGNTIVCLRAPERVPVNRPLTTFPSSLDPGDCGEGETSWQDGRGGDRNRHPLPPRDNPRPDDSLP